ncbi:4Fe-4S ferredoxin [Sphaerochaeta sp. PS]|uniref:4Fe-4S ferredoxin n=1 Tax=Sphaerochaeta sp. PS TaxID=3076336 RepID=UPI0028A380BA|nr:4Fe-4S ferredoxin [Sphaerochaeta sp. PS]MDT4763247.1 4Fe-4S ferredoxin [Sphaerochaeta sp. PS]
MHAVRNIRLCTKDCLCLFVCPTGATDTETGQIDASKCLDGCRLCVDACPSHAIFLIPKNYTPQQKKSEKTKQALKELAKSKAEQERLALDIAKETTDPTERQLARALARSLRILSEDLHRESGFMLPQDEATRAFLQEQLQKNSNSDDFPKEAVLRLLQLL